SAMAFAELGNHERAWEYLSMINPLNHSKTSSDVGVYKVEPYVIAADVYAVEPHTGRGGWTWYTGAAGWTYRLILESILGVTLRTDRLTFRPCVPEDWKGFAVMYRYRDTNYQINFQPASMGGAIKGTVVLDGVILDGTSTLQLRDDLVDHSGEVFY
ncbi:MAG: hypothetical protein NTV34_04480, partial [Proteobacteria bacterium]|nr:hypothetical protein [Pseudomonadota bacterium]